MNSQCSSRQGCTQTPVDSWLTLGEVVAVHIRKSLLKDGVYATAAAQPILRGGGRTCCALAAIPQLEGARSQRTGPDRFQISLDRFGPVPNFRNWFRTGSDRRTG